ncbi:carboxypeptidase-like regulatory domain-containing protein [Bizionia gelidisalsuginis]|uniref:Carboxypeptidase-like regulatory domain-containing protein n=1 Tax=Bizionia gelidisalsuginis TaxID=291188 RepID=A0ABY3MC51_9FLAO|nr:carboxypeptidase-like regulatory domain-containing protein [Bizionia gelidisalsuginis]TYC14885.1 carboxypeptidase-like regulatory domain-containing protein [Bizionia gelidisalsuginis]
MKFLFACILLFSSLVSFSQEKATEVLGVIVDATTNQTLEDVNIVNINQVIGTTTNTKGEFKLRAKTNDTLHLSYIGYKSIKVKVTNDWIKFGSSKITLTELALALEEVVVNELKLTGYLEVDIKQVELNTNYRYSISGLSTGYEAGNKSRSAIDRVLGSIFNPLDFLYNTFSSKGQELKKLRQMKKDDEIRALLASRFDREMLMVLLQVNKIDLDEIITQCNYSKDFINTANDLQILDAISECYEEFKVLNRNGKRRY